MPIRVPSASERDLSRAHDCIEKSWQCVRDNFMSRALAGRPIERFPELSEADAQRTADEARSLLDTMSAVDAESLPHDLAITFKLAQFQANIQAQAGKRYWLAQDCGTDPTLFPLGPYGGRYLSIYALRSLTRFEFSRRSDCDRYLGLMEDYIRLLEQVRTKLVDQAARGIRIPQPALPAIRALVAGQAAAAQTQLEVDDARIAGVAAPVDFADAVMRRIEDGVGPAFAALLELVDAAYAARAPQAVGMGQFDCGVELYEALIAEHLTMPMTIEAVHRAGHERMAQLEDRMAEIRSARGFADREVFHRYLRTDPAWVARLEEDLQARFDAAIRRIEPHLDRLFRKRPLARYRAERLDRRLETGMTYGYFQPPMPGHPDGVYYFNASNISERTLATAPALIYHELIPGHHFHLASQSENDRLHPLRQTLFFTAYNEGWAEYAATLAGEIGMYGDPCEQYGRLLMDALLTCRLVVDTGMNALGWSLERARQYMRDHTIMSEAEIGTETLRYSTDVPAKSLAYKIGEIRMHELRTKAQHRLGAQFDIRDFHDVVLSSGGMPLQVLEWHVTHWLEHREKVG